MKIDQFNWMAGLDRSGWIAVGLFVIFFIIAMMTVIMIVKLHMDGKKYPRTKPLEDLQQAASKPARPVPEKAEVKNTDEKDDYSNPVEEAKVFLDYGLDKQAIDLLEKHLEENPSDETAREILTKAKSRAQ
jgi:hypothetical protein